MEDYEYSVISLDQYWSYVGVPYFLFILGFGLFVLFKITGTGTYAGPAQIKATLRDILSRPSEVGAGPASRTSSNSSNYVPAGVAAGGK